MRNLRPRYSLLTLLVLTALVAGGVKLWYGPHHEFKKSEGEELEYNYILDWETNIRIFGPWVCREFQNGKMIEVELRYFRKGTSLERVNCVLRVSTTGISPPWFVMPENDLTAAETREYKNAIEREMQKFHDQGNSSIYLLWRNL